jgi:hypothetical protein
LRVSFEQPPIRLLRAGEVQEIRITVGVRDGKEE